MADCKFLEKLATAIEESEAESPFHVLSKERFDQMSSEELQLLFRKEHIVVKGVAHTKMAFNRRGLETLGSWEQPRTFQGISFLIINIFHISMVLDLSKEPNEQGFGSRVKTGTLKDLLWHAQQPAGRILNGLEFPSPIGCSNPDQQLSSDDAAWVQTTFRPFCDRETQKPLSDTRWGLAATGGAISYWHVDSDGYGTYVDVQVGIKWWVVATPKAQGPKFSTKSIYATFDPQEVNSDIWDVQAVLLRPGDRL